MQFDEENKDLRAQVQSQRARLDDIVASVPGVVWEAWGEPGTDAHRLDFVSPYAETMLGYPAADWLATPGFWLTLVPAEDRDRAARETAAIYHAGGSGVVQFRWVTRDGRVVWVESHSVTVRDADDRPVGMRGVTMDITERKTAEEALRRQVEEQARTTRALERKVQELDQFAYVTSHDLKAPLRGMANLAHWVAEDLGDGLTPEVASHLALLRGRARRMEAMIEGILQYSRVDRTPSRHERVDVGALVREVVGLLQPPDGFTVEVQPGMPFLVAERLRLQQVFQHLLDNAVKHHDRAGGRVTVSARDDGGFVEFAVADDGPGIAPPYHEKIFVIFQTLESRDRTENTGVGLALARKIVESAGGTISVESEVGRGATFRFTWPKNQTQGK